MVTRSKDTFTDSRTWLGRQVYQRSHDLFWYLQTGRSRQESFNASNSTNARSCPVFVGQQSNQLHSTGSSTQHRGAIAWRGHIEHGHPHLLSGVQTYIVNENGKTISANARSLSVGIVQWTDIELDGRFYQRNALPMCPLRDEPMQTGR